MPDEKSNGQKPPPPESLHYERSQAQCQRCNKDFENFFIEEIEDLKQLRCGSVLISRAELICLHCGAIYNWNVKAETIEKMAVAYAQVLVRIGGYAPE